MLGGIGRRHFCEVSSVGVATPAALHENTTTTPASTATAAATSVASEAAVSTSSSSSPVQQHQSQYNHKKAHNQREPSRWVCIGGFMRFAARRDLELVLGDLKPLQVDALLDFHHNPTGRWAVLMPDSVTAEKLRTHLAERSSRRLTVQTFTTHEFKQLPLASKYGISSSCVRVKNLRLDTRFENVEFFFQDFALAGKRITRFSKDGSSYMVHFATPAEAERCMQTAHFGNFEGSRMDLMWYQCC